MSDRQRRRWAWMGAAAGFIVWWNPLPAHAGVWPPEVTALAQKLGAPENTVRSEALTALERLPDEVVARLLEPLLDGGDHELLLAAAGVAVSRSLDIVAPRTPSWLRDPDARLRRLACVYLQPRPPDGSLALLSRALGDGDASVRRAAARALGHAASPELAVGALLGHLDDPVAEVRREVVESLAKLGLPRAVVPLTSKLQDASVDVRRAAVRALRLLADRLAEASLILALQDSDAEVRADAAAALATVGSTDTTFALVPLLDSSQPLPVRTAALTTLAKVGGEQAVPLLLRELERDAGFLDATPVQDALLAQGPNALEPTLRFLRLLHSDAANAAALTVVAAAASPTARAKLHEGLKTGTWSPAAVFQAVDRFPRRDDLAILLEGVQHSAAPVRQHARRALDAVLDGREEGRVVDVILRQLHDARTGGTEKPALVRLLGKTGSPRATDALAALTQHPVLPVKLAAIEALRTAPPSPHATVLLTAALEHENGLVRGQAASTLAQAAPLDAAQAVLLHVQRSDQRDVAALAVAVAGALGRNSSVALDELATTLLRNQPPPLQDAILEGLGRNGARTRAARQALARAATSSVAADRRKAAEMLSTLPSFHAELVGLARDSDAGVRANAAWSLGARAETSDVELLRRLAHDDSVLVAANGLTSLAFLAQRQPIAVTSTVELLCENLGQQLSPERRAAAIGGLRVVGTRCPARDAPRGQLEREALALDPSVEVRHMALLLLGVVPALGDARAKVRCGYEEGFRPLARACERGWSASSRQTEPLSVIVARQGQAESAAESVYALRRADGLVRYGISDRRGAVFEAFAPVGNVALAPVPTAWH